MSAKFDRWIEKLTVDVIEGEFGYEPGEFNVMPANWHPLYRQGLTPLEAFQRALAAHRQEPPSDALKNAMKLVLATGLGETLMTGETPPAAKGVTDEMVEAGAKACRNITFNALTMDECRDAVRVALLAALSLPAPGEGEAPHPLAIYADSYAMMSRMDDGKVDCRSVEVDIRQNMIPVTQALSTPSSGGLAVKVKPLRWEQPDGDAATETSSWLGHGTDLCQYYIGFQGGSWWTPFDGEDGEEYPTIEAAKAAAQSEYEARILSALDRTTLPTAEGEKP